MAGKRRCKTSLPPPTLIDKAVSMLRARYPDDEINWKGGGREQAEQAVAAARWAFQLNRGQPCYSRKLAAAAALFYEVITLHPLTDGNKRLATLLLDAFLIKNRLPRPRNIANAALRVAAGEWSQEDVYRWLLRAYRARKARHGRGG